MIDAIYAFMDKVLPFEFLRYDFMKTALICAVLAAVLFGVIGTAVVSNRMAFFSDSLGHAALTGVAIGVLIGIDDFMVSMVAFAVLLAVAIVLVKSRSRASTETTISVFSSMAVALGILLLSRGGGFSKYSAYLIGDILAMTETDMLVLAVLLAVVIVYWVFGYNRLMLTGLNRELAHSRGIRTIATELVFTAVVAVVVTVCIRFVGLMLINSMLVLPAASARNIAKNTRSYQGISVVFALAASVFGLIVAYYADTSAGAAIVLILAVIYFITLIFARK